MFDVSTIRTTMKMLQENNERFRRTARLIETERADDQGHSVGKIAVRPVQGGQFEFLIWDTRRSPGSQKPHTSRAVLYLSREQVADLCETLLAGLREGEV